ncbi:MAG: nucleotidyltransferase domain-containing protein [Candidatus Melainabacteria bacterium]|jgi:uncharacterized protein|nr:nucleotidyltransferase domain-containing protein [Candidatus Melainabacteria bacterium]
MVKKLNELELDQALDQFVANLNGKIGLNRVLLYGSYAKGTATDNSDIDLLVISEDLPANHPKGANGFKLCKLAGFDNVYPGLEVIGVHPSKLNHEVTKSFFDEVLATGREIVVN